MSQHKRNDELTDATIQPYPPKEPNAESIEVIREGNAFFASGEPGRFGNAADLIDAALRAPEVQENSNAEEAIVSEVSDWRGTYLAIFVRFPEARENRKPLSTTWLSTTKPQVAETQNRGLVGKSRFPRTSVLNSNLVPSAPPSLTIRVSL